MNLRKHFSILMIVAINSFTFPSQSKAQEANTKKFSIGGYVTDSLTQKRLDYINVHLMDAQSAILKTDYSKADGTFSFHGLKPMKYIVTLTGIGYQNKSRQIDLSDKTQVTLDLGEFKMSPSVTGLKEVSITALKPLVQQEIDRIAYDVQADPESKVFSVMDMMRKVPLVTLDADDNLLLKGNTDFKILINGKPSSMIERNYKEILRSMPASSIQRIEVITTPPAKYDAEGLAGIINIITNKKIDNGYNGSINLSERFPQGGPGLGGSFNLKLGKIGMSAFGGANLNVSPIRVATMSRETFGSAPTSLYQTGDRVNRGKNAYLGYEVSYEIDTLNLVSVQLNLNGDYSNGTSGQISNLYLNGVTEQAYKLDKNSRNGGRGMDGAINYQKGFKADKNRMLTFSYRSFAFENYQNSEIVAYDRFHFTTLDYKQDNIQDFSEHTLQADLVFPVKKLTIEAGIKAILRKNQSDFKYFDKNPETDQYEQVEDLSNRFNNTQNVFGAYNTYQYAFNKWSFKMGLRLEQTVIHADFLSTASKVNQNYFNVIPSLSVSRKLKNTSTVNFGYTQRISRPGIYQLNPFVDRSNPNFEQSGNPDLKPATLNDLQATYSWSKKMSVNVGLGFVFFNGIIFQTTSFDPSTNITRTTYGNVGRARLPNANANINYPVTKKWTFSANTRLAYGIVNGYINGQYQSNQGLMYNVSLSTNYAFNHGWRAGLSLFQNGPNLSFQGTSNTMTSWSASINKHVVKEKLTVSFAVNNLFNKYRVNHQETFGPGFSQFSDRFDYFESFNFSVNYKFGKLKEAIKKNKRGIRNDDVQNSNQG